VFVSSYAPFGLRVDIDITPCSDLILLQIPPDAIQRSVKESGRIFT
jgi:hypothetical protein